MNVPRPARRPLGLLPGLLLALAIASPGAAQPGTAPPVVAIVAAPDLGAAQTGLLAALADDLRAALPPGTEVDLHPPQAEADPAALILTAGNCGDGLCLTFTVTPPHDLTLLTPDLEAAIAAAWPLRVPLGDSSRPAIIDVAAGLFGYAAGDCAALSILERAGPTLADIQGVEHGALLAFYLGLCPHLQHDYPAALTVLAGPDRAALARAGAPWPLRLLWDAYAADSHAQAFAFDRALAWDTRAIALGAALAPDEPLAARLLPELYLLQGRHRLYLYEWDRVLEDYNAALALPEVPARAYYDRGLLYYTQNVRQAAYDDLTRYLALEPDPASRLIPLARRYAAELEALLATPPAS